MDNRTKRQLKKQDRFILATEGGVTWAKENRQTAIIAGVALVLVIVALVGGFALFEHRVSEAQTAFGNAMSIYQTPVATPGQQVPPGVKTYPDSKTRAAAANTEFQAVAKQYGMTEPGRDAEYFAGITFLEMGENGSAETTLKKVASGWNADTSALARQALAQLYQGTGRDQDAEPLYQELIKGHATTVTPNAAKLELAEMYASEGKTQDADKLYADLKDKDKDAQGQPGPAGAIASEKLNPTTPAAGAGISQ